MANNPYIIAECGVNHNGSLNTAKEMIVAAKECGADCVKFQTYKTELLCSREYQEDLYYKLKCYELSYTEFHLLDLFCKTQQIDFMSTPDDLKSAEFLNLFQPKFKISSIEAANWHLLRLVNTFKKPVFISNGLVNSFGLEKALELLKDCDVTIMQCISAYPATREDYCYINNPVRLDYKLGVSDHTIDLTPPLIGKALTTYEKHFTLDKTQPGFDHHMSLEPHEFKQYVENIRNAY